MHPFLVQPQSLMVGIHLFLVHASTTTITHGWNASIPSTTTITHGWNASIHGPITIIYFWNVYIKIQP